MKLRTNLPTEQHFWRIAHRGASDHAPENTLAAFVKAAELGANMVELDVQASADGALMVIHDAELSRTTNGHGALSLYTLEELKKLDAGDGQTIPTLVEAITCCQEHNLALYIELKGGSVIPGVVKLIQAYDLYGAAIVASFRPDWVAQVKALDERIITSVLFGAVNVDAVSLAQSVQADYVHPCWERAAPEPHKLLTPEWIARVRAVGLGIICWHEERPSEIAALRRLGVDGICSNAPELLR